MTASSEQAAAAGTAQQGGEGDARAHAAHAEAMQSSISGSEVETSDSGRGPEDSAVQWSEPHGLVTGPTRDNAGENRSPNVSDPLDNSQSQP
jgi:hypothetical protein